MKHRDLSTQNDHRQLVMDMSMTSSSTSSQEDSFDLQVVFDDSFDAFVLLVGVIGALHLESSDLVFGNGTS